MDLCKSMIISRKLIVPGYDIPHKAQICRSPNRQQNKIHNNDQNSNENHDRDGERKRESTARERIKILYLLVLSSDLKEIVKRSLGDAEIIGNTRFLTWFTKC